MSGVESLEVPNELRIDSAKVASDLSLELRKFLKAARRNAGVVGLSGGVDSAVTCALTAMALGPSNVFACLLPSESTPATDVDDARAVIDAVGIPVENVQEMSIDVPVRSLVSSVAAGLQDVVAVGNIKARTRMILLHAVAHVKRGIVIGTGDRSELLIGYFTKYGDGGVDVLPLGDLYKTQVRQLARDLGLPASVYEKPPSPQLWQGHSAEQELGITYPLLDQILLRRHDLHQSPSQISRGVGVPVSTIKGLDLRTVQSEHKRGMPPVLHSRAVGRKVRAK